MEFESILVRETTKRLGSPTAPLRGQTAKQLLMTYGQDPQIMLPFAWLYASEFPGNEWHRHPALLEALETIVSHVFTAVPNRRMWYPLAHAFRLVRDALTPAAAAQWKSKLTTAVYEHLLPELQKRDRLTVFSSANVGYGTNHLAVELAGLTGYLSTFCKDADFDTRQPGGTALTAYAQRYLERFMNYMHVDGFWPECDGPADNYNTLSASALMRAADDLGCVETYRGHFAAAARFAALVILPDGRGVDITDGRNHFKQQHLDSIRSCYAGVIPAGKAMRANLMAHLAPASALPEWIGGEFLAEALCNHLFQVHDCKEPAQSIWHGGDATHTLTAGFHLLKRGPWIAGASTFASPPRTEGHWNLDYQNLWTLYHAQFGQIVFGANGKDDMAGATFHKHFESADSMVVRDPKALRKYRPYAGKFTARADGFRLWREYRGFEATLDLQIESPRRAVLNIRVDARTDAYPVMFTLLPMIEFGGTFCDGADRATTLGNEPITRTGAEMQGRMVLPPAKEPTRGYEASLSTGKPEPLTIHLPAEAQLTWPYSFWDPYNLTTDRYDDVKERNLLVDIPIGPAGAKIVFEVG